MHDGRPLLYLHDPLLVMRVNGSDTDVPPRPALAPWCRLAEDGHRVLVEHGGTVVTFEGGAARLLLPALLPLLDGTRTVDELAVELGQPAAPAVENALALLAASHLLVDGEHRPPDESPVTAAASYAAAVSRGATQAAALDAIARARVSVLGTGSAAEEAQQHLEAAGVCRVDRRPLIAERVGDDLMVATPGPSEVEGLARLNEIALEHGTPWLQVLPFDGRLTIVGPLFVPGASACRQCFVLRRGACSGYEDDFELVDRAPLQAPSRTPLTSIAAAIAALLVLRWVSGSDPTLPGRFYALESNRILGLTFEHVLRVPRCGACGSPQRAVPSPWFEESG